MNIKNKAVVKNATINWLISETAPILLDEGHDGFSRTTIPMPDHAGGGYLEFLPLGSGIDIARGVHHFAPEMAGQLLPFVHVQGELPEPILMISVARTGKVCLKDFCTDADYVFQQGISLFQHVDRIDYQPTLDASEDLEVIMLHISLPVLEQLFGEDYARDILGKLRLLTCPSAMTLAVPFSISQSLFLALSGHLKGSIRRLYAQSKSMEYICNLVDYLTGQSLGQDKKTPKQTAIEQLYADLTHLEGKVPSLEKLADQYGMSSRSLNNEFKRLYGVSIFTFVSDQRLISAHEALLNSNTPMKVLADHLGYSNVNHFISAFRQKFGYTPGSLRLNMVHQP